MSTGGCLTWELFHLEGWASVAGKVPKLISEVPGLHLEGVDCVFSVLPEFCVRMPDSHVEKEIKNCFVVGWEEEAVEHGHAALDRMRNQRRKARCATWLTWSMSSKCLADMFFMADMSPVNLRIVS